ncbi:hypothetical protein GCM10023067_59030 [Aminobacter aganoensis]|nr:hypothetical protein [Aminobacter aganoensis]
MVTERAADMDLPSTKQATAAELAAILLDSLGELAKTGNVESACRLAGRACARLRNAEPQMARRFDVFLHRQTRHLEW